MAVFAAVGFSLGPALLGLLGTQDDACIELHDEAPHQGPGRFHAFEDESSIVGVYSRCEMVRHGAPPAERTTINWIGTINALAFVVGVFFGSAGILGLIDRRRAALITAACVVICFAMVVVFFV